MIAFDLPPPAIIQPREIADIRFIHNGDDYRAVLPRDYVEMPRPLRWTVPLSEVRPYLPDAYRLLGDGILWSLLAANLPGFPGVIMAGGIKTAFLFTASDTFDVPNDWNRNDNIVHAVGGGGNGHDAIVDAVFGDDGGGGGGGGAWAALVNGDYDPGDTVTITISGNVTFDSSLVLLAAAGASAGAHSGGTSPGGAGGTVAASVGTLENAGGNGANNNSNTGGGGGGAGGPSGAGESASGFQGGDGDAGIGGAGGDTFGGLPQPGQDGIDGPGGGWNPDEPVNAGSGGGGAGGLLDARPGKLGGLYGAGGGGGGGLFPDAGLGAAGRPGCVLVINNVSG